MSASLNLLQRASLVYKRSKAWANFLVEPLFAPRVHIYFFVSFARFVLFVGEVGVPKEHNGGAAGEKPSKELQHRLNGTNKVSLDKRGPT